MKTTAIADSIGIELSKPRTVGRMTNRANAAFAEDSVPSYYRINAFLKVFISRILINFYNIDYINFVLQKNLVRQLPHCLN
jgi:hypothetical protein